MIKQSWQTWLDEEVKQPYMIELKKALIQRYQNERVYPTKKNLLACLEDCEIDEIKVVILGQDPYHQPNQAHGMSFSVQKGQPIPPSLRNIYQELKDDLGMLPPAHGYLKKWSMQGVLLLNTVLSVTDSKPGSHRQIGWETFTDHIIGLLNKQDQPIVFVLWGRDSRSKKALLTNPKHLIIESAHPSPLSAHRGFFGSRPFSKINQYLKSHGVKPIDWSFDDV